jgi:hypothetical protein
VTQRSSPARRGSALLAFAALLAGSPAAAQSDDRDSPSLIREGGLGAAAALVSMIYCPLKLVYAASGIVLGSSSFLWTWGDQDAAMAVVDKSVGGDYVITPDMLRGSVDLRFTGGPGEDAGHSQATAVATGPPPL